MYNKLYHDNYMIKKWIENESKYSSIYNHQHKQYLLINHCSKMIIQKQQITLNETNQYYSIYKIKVKENWLKSKHLTQLEYSVGNINRNWSEKWNLCMTQE